MNKSKKQKSKQPFFKKLTYGFKFSLYAVLIENSTFQLIKFWITAK